MFLIVNFGTPPVEAVKISPVGELLSTTKAANGVLPETDATARVLIVDLMSTPAKGVAAFIPTLPVPFGAMLRFAFVVVPIVALDPLPRLSCVAETPSVAAEVIVAREEDVIVVKLLAVRVVTPERANAALVVRVPSEVALIAVVPVKLVVNALMLRTEPAPPLRGDILMFPVVAPPRVRVLFLRDWIVAVPPVRDIPLPAPPPVVALIVAVGVPSLIPVTANSAVEVALLPRRKSRVEVSFGVIAPFNIFQLEPVPVHDTKEGMVPPTRQSFTVPTAVCPKIPVVAV